MRASETGIVDQVSHPFIAIEWLILFLFSSAFRFFSQSMMKVINLLKFVFEL